MSITVGKSVASASLKPGYLFTLAIIGGMACHWFWSYIATVTAAEVFFWDAQSKDVSYSLYYPISLAALVVTIAIGTLISIRAERAGSSVEKARFVRTAIAGSAIACVSTFCLIWAQSDTEPGTVLLIFAGLGTGIGSGIMLPICWSETIQYLSTKRMLVAFAASIIAAFSALLLVKPASREITAALACVLPLAETGCFVLANSLKDFRNRPKTLPYQRIRITQTLLRIGMPSAIFGVILGILQELCVTQVVNSGDDASQAVLIISSLFAASLVLCSLALFSRGEKHALAQVLFLVIIISLSFVFACSISEEFTLMAMLVANVSLHLMVWMFGLKIVHQGKVPSLLVFSTLYGFTCVGTMFSVIPMKHVPSISDFLSSSAIWPVMIVASFAVAYSFWPSKKDVENHMVVKDDESNVDNHDSFQAACQHIAEQYGLSPRETEILSFIARGRSITYISETLFISPNTAKSHRRRLYEKLGVHKNQEVISLVCTEIDLAESRHQE